MDFMKVMDRLKSEDVVHRDMPVKTVLFITCQQSTSYGYDDGFGIDDDGMCYTTYVCNRKQNLSEQKLTTGHVVVAYRRLATDKFTIVGMVTTHRALPETKNGFPTWKLTLSRISETGDEADIVSVPSGTDRENSRLAGVFRHLGHDATCTCQYKQQWGVYTCESV
jgi:hypothetical protein